MENTKKIFKIENLEERIEALLFLSKELLTVSDIAKFYKMENFEIEEAVKRLAKNREKMGINLRIENDVISLVSNPMYGEDVKNFFNPELRIRKLTKSTMETLAIIAYKGPITRTEIEQIRGVSVEKAMANLLEKNLVYISGKKKTIGTPNIYQVTENFYSYLGIKGRDEMPGYEQFREIQLMENEEDEENDIRKID